MSVAGLQASRRGVLANRGHGRLRLFSLSFLSVPLVILLLLSLSMVMALPAAATDPGSLDTTFGTGGKVTTDFGGGPDAGKSVTIQSDGKIVVAGSGGVTHTDFAVARYGGTVPPSNSSPLADAGVNIILASDAVAAASILGSATDPDGDALTYRWLEGTTVLQDWSNVGTGGEATLNLSSLPNLSIGTHTLILAVNDGTVTSSDEMILTVGNSASHASPSGGGTYQINSSVSIGGQVSDFDGDTLSYQWLEGATIIFSGTIQAVPGGNPVSLTPEIIDNLVLGTHTLTLEVNDGINPAVSGTIAVIIVDTIAPTLAPAPDKTILWPPNHKMVKVTIFPNASDNSGNPVNLTVSVASNEPQDGLGDGDVSPDWTTPVINDGIISLQLRAERSGKGNGRIYTITITATDEANNSSTALVEIVVPHDGRDNDENDDKHGDKHDDKNSDKHDNKHGDKHDKKQDDKGNKKGK